MRFLRRWLILSLAILIASGCGKSPEGKWTSFQDAFWTSHPKLRAAAVLDADQWNTALQQFTDTETYAAQVLTMAKSDPGSKLAERQLWWIIAYCPQAPSCKKAIEIYSADYSQNFAMKCSSLIHPRNAFVDRALQEIIRSSPNRTMQGQATLARARYRQLILHDNATAESLYQQVIAQFGEIKADSETAATLADLATADLANLRNPLPAALQAGEKVPELDLVTTDGTALHLPDSYKGKLVLLDFWATWCGPCVAEMPNVVSAYDKYHARGLEVLSISLDKENSGPLVASFTKKLNMNWPQIYDGKYLDTPIYRKFGIEGIPHGFLVDGDTGIILADGDDARGPKLAAAIEAALAKKETAGK